MSPLGVLLLVLVATSSVLVTLWVGRGGAQRRLDARVRELDELHERRERQHALAHERDRRAQEVARAQHAEQLARAAARAETLAKICQVDSTAVPPLYPDRPAPVELDAIAARLRGLTLIECATVSDARGLVLDRATSRDANDLAALVPAVASVADDVAPLLGWVRGVTVHANDARIVELRPLPAWTRGAWLVAQSSAQRPAPAALDAAVAHAFAVRDEQLPAAHTPVFAATGRLGPGGPRSDALADELDRATRGLGARSVALVHADQVLAGTAAEGLPALHHARILAGMRAIQRAAAACLHASEITRVELDGEPAVQVSLAQLGDRSRLALLTLTVGRRLDALEVERVAGRLRRFLDDGAALVVTASAAGASQVGGA